MRKILLGLLFLGLLGLGLWKIRSTQLPNMLLDIHKITVQSFQTFWTSISDLKDAQSRIKTLRTENQQFREKLAEQSTLLNRTNDLLVENERLKNFLQFAAPRREAWIAAEVVSHPVDLWTRQLLINKGQAEGIRLYAVVMNQDGLVGMVSQLGLHSATVRLITHPLMKVSVINAETREIAMISGQGERQLRLDYVDQKSEVENGQKYFTSGQSEIFPPAIFVGELVRLKTSPHHLFQNLIIQPAVHLDKLDYVLIQR